MVLSTRHVLLPTKNYQKILLKKEYYGNRSLDDKFEDFKEKINNAIPPGTGFEKTLELDSFRQNNTEDNKIMDLSQYINKSDRSETCESPTHVDLPYFSGNDSESRIVKVKRK